MTFSNPIRIGTRGSRLALAQAAWVVQRLSRTFPDSSMETVIVKTAGDKDRRTRPQKFSQPGIFVKELEEALFKKEIDLAVHSLKDLPTELPQGLKLGAITRRLFPGDVLLYRDQKNSQLSPSDSDPPWMIGTSSLRREFQLKRAWPACAIVPLRGNIDSRLHRLSPHEEKKLSPPVDAVVLAYAGLHRLGYLPRQRTPADPVTNNPLFLNPKRGARHRTLPVLAPPSSSNNPLPPLTALLLPYPVMLPAPGQGALALEIRQGDRPAQHLAAALHHEKTFFETSVERGVLKRLGGGCHLPLGTWVSLKKNGAVEAWIRFFQDASHPPLELHDFFPQQVPDRLATALTRHLLESPGEPVL